jgi:hypothetical protein
VIADVIGDCADTIHVALSASTSDKAHYGAHEKVEGSGKPWLSM